jgi:hypothetical protein
LADVSGLFPPRSPEAIFALDLIINGEDYHLETRFPLHVWDDLSEDERARVLINAMHHAAEDIVTRFAPLITVTRDEMPGATNLQRAGAELRGLFDRYRI